MTAAELLAHVRNQGVAVYLEGESLRYRAPRDTITPEILESMQSCKPDLLGLLRREGTRVDIITRKEDLLRMEEEIHTCPPKQVFMDTETTGLDPHSDRLVLIQILANGTAYLIRPDLIGSGRSDDLVYWGGIQRLLMDSNIVKVFHNAKFDLQFLKRRLFDGYCFEILNLFDTYLAEQILTAGISSKGDHSLGGLVQKYLGNDLDKSARTSFEVGKPLSSKQIDYAVHDVTVLERIFRKQATLLSKAGLIDVAQLEFAIIPAVAEIELNGMLVDQKKLAVLKNTYERRLNELESELKSLVADVPLQKQHSLFGEVNVNFRSPVQTKEILAALGHKVKSTATETLERINHPFAKLMVEHRKASKLLSSFIEKLPRHVNDNGRIHPQFFQTGTEAGRFSCQKPNLQQIPKEQEWRDLFVAPVGYRIITADYSQIELRILAEYSQDPAFLEAYRTGEDLHSQTASEMFGVRMEEVTKDQRNVAKTINFGLCYGMSASGLASRLNIPPKQAQRFISAYFRAYPHVRNTLQRLGTRAVTRRYSETLSGRKRYYGIPDSISKQKSLERKGRNTPIQGTCGDILKKAIQYLMEDLAPYDAKIINLIHDELVLEIKTDQAQEVKKKVEEAMIRAGRFYLRSVPIEVEAVVDRVWRK